jgi:hypothetical protein
VPEVEIYVDSAALQKAMKEAGDDLVAELKAGNKALGEIVAARARQIVPVRSGALRKTISATKAATGAKITAGTPGLLSKVPYAGPIHYGWDNAFGDGVTIEARPFLSDALDDVRDEVVDAYDKMIADLLKKAGLR